MLAPDLRRRPEPKGAARPRIAPPRPLRSRGRDATKAAAEIGISFMPWQETVEQYLEALGPGELYLYPEVAAVVARQNGKTEILVPHIRRRLLAGRRIMHTAQNRELPREVFSRVAELMVQYHSDLLKSEPRFANGQEEIKLQNGGRYRIVAPTRGGARGPSNDDLIIDEVRELETHDFIAAANPTLAASPNPQTLYLSNAGDESSAVLNSLKLRAGTDPALAYLEWSADPDRKPGDLAGWLEANPAIGHLPAKLRNLRREYESHRLGGTLAVWETEYLCRPVVSMRERLVADAEWIAAKVDDCGRPKMPRMAIASDPEGRRASAAIAWQSGEDVNLRLLFDVPGNPIDTDELGRDLRATAAKLGVLAPGYDPLTDRELAKVFRQSKPISGAEFANATALFATKVKAGQLHWDDADQVGQDLVWTAKKAHDESGSYQAVRAKDDRPITAALAAIRAVWLASGPQPPPARIY